MRRIAPLLAGVAAVGVIVPLIVGAGRPALILLPLFGALGAVALVAARRPAVVEPGWVGPTGASPTAVAVSPDRGLRERPPIWRVAAALARAEARDLGGGAWFGAGIGFLIVCYLLFAWVYAGDNGSHWAEIVDLAPWLAHPMVGMVVVAAHRGATRSRRDGTDELFDSCPTAPGTRTWGSVGSGWVPVVALAVFALVFGVTVAVRSPNLYGSIGLEAVAEVLGALALGFGGVALGVTLARWVPFGLAPAVAVVAVGFCSLRLASAGDPGWNPYQQLSTFPPLSGDGPIFTDPPAWSHLAWILSLTGAVLVIAAARHRRDRAVAVAGLVACLLLAVTGVAATRPMSETAAARIADLVAHPADHQVCRTTGALQVCVYGGHQELLSRVLAGAAPVVAMLPDDVPLVTLRQRYEGDLRDLPPEVRRRLDGVPPLAAGEVALGYSIGRRELEVPRFLLGLRALDLPVEVGPDQVPAVIAGQARGVVALWLALSGLDAGAVRRLTSGTTVEDLGDRTPEAFDRGYAWPEGCSTPPVVWSAQDLRAARALNALPGDVVRTLVHTGWARWSDPATGTDDLMAAAGLAPVGPFDVVKSRRVDPC